MPEPVPALFDHVAPDWREALLRIDPSIPDRLSAIETFLDAETAAGRPWLPAREHLLRAFSRPLAEVRVLLVGQDPYPTPGHAVGLSFSVAPHVQPLPRSLMNIDRELQNDLDITPGSNGDLSAWADQGVLLLNRVLSVRTGDAGSHRRKGWEAVTDAAITALVERGGPCVALLWGRDAQALTPRLGSMPVVASTHPSPLSASRGFFGSRPFSQVNALLLAQGSPPVQWSRDPTQEGEERLF